MRGSLGSLPVVTLNGRYRSGGVRLVSPLVVEMQLACSAKPAELLGDDAPLPQVRLASRAGACACQARTGRRLSTAAWGRGN